MTTATLPTIIIPSNIENLSFEDYIKRLTLISLDMTNGTAIFDSATVSFDSSTTSFDSATVSFTGATIIDFPSSGLPDPLEVNNIQSFPGGNDLTIQGVDTGDLNLLTEDSSTTNTADIRIETGSDVSQTFLSGNISITTGVGNQTGFISLTTGTTLGSSGPISLTTGDGSFSESGDISLTTGDSNVNSTGSITIITGNTASNFIGTGSGDITLETGSIGAAPATLGSITLDTLNEVLIQSTSDSAIVSTAGNIDLTANLGDINMISTDTFIVSNNNIQLVTAGGTITMTGRISQDPQSFNLASGSNTVIPAGSGGNFVTSLVALSSSGVFPGSIAGGFFVPLLTGIYQITLHTFLDINISAGSFDVELRYSNLTSTVTVTSVVVTNSTSSIPTTRAYNASFLEELTAGDIVQFSTNIIDNGGLAVTGGNTSVARVSIKYLQ